MLPAFHGERMRAYEGIITELATREIESWPARRDLRDPPAHAGADARGDHAGRLRRERPRARRAAAGAARRPARRDLLATAAGAGPARPALRRARSARRAEAARTPRSTSCWPPRSPSGAPTRTSESREDILSMLVAARFEDGEPMSDAELRDQLMTLLLAGPRDHGDGARLDLRPAPAPPGRPRAPAVASWTPARRPTCGR